MSPLTIKKTAGTIDKSYVNLLRILLIKWHEKRLAVWNDSNAKNHCRNINLVGVASARHFTALISPLELQNYECLFLFLYYSVLIYISCIRWHVERQKRSRYPCKAINLRKYKALDELVERFVFIESQSICVPLSVWVSPKLRGLTLQSGLYLFIIIIIIIIIIGPT